MSKNGNIHSLFLNLKGGEFREPTEVFFFPFS